MKILNSKFFTVLTGMLLAFGSVPAGYADDTELFIADADPLITGAKPNILFIIDTSGSMSGKVVTQELWDPNKTWAGSYDSDAVYWDSGTSVPDSGTNRWFQKTSFRCDAGTQAFPAFGQFQDKMKRYRTNQKRWLNLSNNHTHKVECAADAGVHGDTAASADTYVADGPAGPWSTASNVSWGADYTVYDGNWLNWFTTGGTITKTRLEIVQEVVNDLLDNITGVNVGLMRLQSEHGGPVIHEIAPVETASASMQAQINAMTPGGWTPLSEVMYEAGQYFAGRAVDFGNVGPIDSVAGSRVGGLASSNTYEAPTNFACQKNYVVLLSDGQPTRDTSANGKITSLPEFSTLVGNSCDGSGDGACLDDMAEYLHKYDLEQTTLVGLQNVTTYTIGFTQEIQSLIDAALKGGGEYHRADDTASLTGTLTDIVLSIMDDATTFTAPAVPVNAFNRTQNLSDVFVSVFEPSGHMHWPGNLKKYKLVSGVLQGQNNLPAVNPATGYFDENNGFSYWSASIDGDRVPDGGAANELPAHASRNLYTNIAGNNLTSPANAVTVGNAGITAAMIGAPSADRDATINWARGQDVLDDDGDGSTTDDRYVMGDPLHVRPITIIYGGTEAAPEGVVLTSTNDGYLHSVDMETGSEEWSFIPSRLLDRLYALQVDDLSASKSYGLDGGMSAAVLNNDYIPGIDSANGEKLYVVFGMRRGGNTIFAMDLTDRTSPRLVWEIDENSAGGDFADMGQSWAAPLIEKVNVDGVVKDVVIFGGGYDTGQDLPGYRSDNVGNAVYMVDIETGGLIWSAGVGIQHDLQLNMQHSIPAPITAVDLTGDRIVNRLYVADTGGRLWRFDVNNGATTANDLVSGGVLATLGGADLVAPTLADTRRFYNGVDVVPVISGTHEPYLSLNIGSGHRAHPLDVGTEDWFFSVRDFNVFNSLPSDSPVYANPVTMSDLIDITNDTRPVLPASEPGWRLRMEVTPGEKVLGDAVPLKGTIFFVSFSPGGASACQAGAGTNYFYQVEVTDGAPSQAKNDSQYDDNNPPSKELRYEELNQGGIAPGPVLFFTEDSNDPSDKDPDICVGIECQEAGVGDSYSTTYWVQDATQ